MTDSQLTIGQWQFGVKESDTDQYIDVGLVIVGEPELAAFDIAANVGEGWSRIGGFTSHRAAITTAELIARLASSREHARIGGETAGSGIGGDHPGVEWITSLDEADERTFTERLGVHGMARLWVTPSRDGTAFAMIDPSTPDGVLGQLDSEQAADVLVWMIDMVITAGRV
jgi:hypothetical protein